MHELGIVFHIINMVEKAAAEGKAASVASVTLELGEVSGVVPDYLTDCWNWAVKKTERMREAALVIETIPAVTFCEGCGQAYPTVPQGKTCPHCGSEETWLRQGNEIQLKEIAIREEQEDTHGNI